MAENNSVITSYGMPCHKYILRNIKTDMEAQTFLKSYVATLTRAHVCDSDITDSFLLLSSQLVNINYDFTVWENHKEGLQLIEDIRFDTTVASYKKCTQLYRKYDNKCSACALCPLSDKYKNGNQEKEEAIVTFCLASPDNLAKVLSLGIKKEHFVSVCDIVNDFSCMEKPIVYPFLSKTFEAISEHNCGFDELVAYHNKEMNKKRLPKKSLTANILLTICDVLCDQMLRGNVCDYDTVVGYVNELLPKEDAPLADCLAAAGGLVDAHTVINPKHNMGIREFDSYYSTDNSSTDEPGICELTMEDILLKMEASETLDESPAEHTTSVVSYHQEQITETDAPEDDKAAPATVPNIPTDADAPGAFEAESFQDEKQTDQHPSKNAAESDNPIASEDTEFSDQKEYRFHHTEDNDIHIREIETIPDTDLFYHEGTDNDLIGIPLVSLDELQHFCINLDQNVPHLLSLFESYVLKDKRLVMEYILSEGKPYLLLYSPRIHAMFYTSLSPKHVRDVLVPILSMPSITKLCYYPYATVGILWKAGIYVKSIYSLFGISACLYGEHHMNQRECLEYMGCVPAKGGVHLKPEGKIISIPILYMHNYFACFYRLKKEVISSAMWNWYEERNLFDVALSRSYYKDLYLEKPEVLFTILNANKFSFIDAADTTAKINGRILIYQFSHSPAPINELIMRLVSQLEHNGKFKKYKSSIVSMGDDFLKLFVAREHERYMLDAIHVALLNYLDEKEYRGVTYKIMDVAEKTA